jgi:DNA polymerase I
LFDKFTLADVTVMDIEANGLDDATLIHLVVFKTGETQEVFRNVTSDPAAREGVRNRLAQAKILAGHNVLGFDIPTLGRLLGVDLQPDTCVLDTLVLSRLLNYGIDGGHSLGSWGDRLGIKKIGKDISDWSRWTQEMEERCLSDTDINYALVKKYWRIVSDPTWQDALRVEHFVATQCKVMHDTGFPFDLAGAVRLRSNLVERVEALDEAIRTSFPPRATLVAEVTPRLTQTGTLNRGDFRWFDGSDLSCFDGGPFCRFEYVEFNPGSVRQVVERLNELGWKPTEKTDGHVKFLKIKPPPASKPEEVAEYQERRDRFRRYGWKVNEDNLQTLPADAPAAAFKLAERIVLASRLSDLDEWLAVVVEGEDHEPTLHGSFTSIGAWTGRLSHQKPNTANIPQSKPSDKDTPFQKEIQALNGKMRSLFRAKTGHRLIGTDADGIQMRIFAHLCKDQVLIDSLVKGRKEDKTDTHSLNQRLLGSVCGSRDVAKTFIYAFLLGAGAAKVAEILSCTFGEAKDAVARFVSALPGLNELKTKRIPGEAAAGYFVGLDGRKVVCDSAHLMLAGHLQNGEKVIMARAMEKWVSVLDRERVPYFVHNWVHDEWQTGCPDDDDICAHIQEVQLQALLDTGVELGMMLPTPGSSDWGYNWKETH